MTFHLLELLSSLVLRRNVQGLVEQGLVPLITTVSSYLLIQHDQERFYKGDPTFFTADENQEMHRVQSIRNQCLTLISSLIEVFGDMAVQATLLVVQNMSRDGKTVDAENPWLQRLKMPGAADNDFGDDEDDEEEESKTPLQEGVDPEQARMEVRMRKEAREFKALLREHVYISAHPNNEWKRRELAILLIGSFIKDISAFLIRNPIYDLLQNLFDEMILCDFTPAPPLLRSLLVGRAL